MAFEPFFFAIQLLKMSRYALEQEKAHGKRTGLVFLPWAPDFAFETL
jgi:hypothetical protein